MSITGFFHVLIYYNHSFYTDTYFSLEIAQVTTSYTASGTEQLSLAPGQLIVILKKNSSGWWQGELQVIDEEVFLTGYQVPYLDEQIMSVKILAAKKCIFSRRKKLLKKEVPLVD